MRQFALPQDEPAVDDRKNQTGDILQGLNDTQREAATELDGPVMIVAGAGSGKTRTLTYRIAHLLAAERAFPSQVLALTFTNKAAREMQTRIRGLVGEEQAGGLWMGTFHSIFARILRRECGNLGYTGDYSIYDQEDSERLVREIMKSRGIDTKEVRPRQVLSHISSAKNQLVSPEHFSGGYGKIEEIAAEVYGIYVAQLKRANAMDFDDLLVKPIEIFEASPDILERYQNRWKYLHIDEYQDTNRAQYALTKMLAERHRNICVVGDDAQSIYAFRGADIRNILDFQRDYPGARIVRLEQNYRSTRRILQLADSVIKNNKDQLKKTLWTENPEGEYVRLLEAVSEKDEAHKVVDAMQDLQMRSGQQYRSFAVLFRTNAQSRSLEDALRRVGIPYQLIGGISFYRRAEIKNSVAYLRLLVNPDDDESLRRVINYPRRGIGDSTLEKIAVFAERQNLSIWGALGRLDEIGLPTRAANAVRSFRALIQKFKPALQEQPAENIAREIIHEAGILADLRQENTIESLGRWENIQELFNAIAEFSRNTQEPANLSTFLQEVSLVADVDSLDGDDNKVTLMTLHSSKGLEFPVVFITGLEEGLFPLARAAQNPVELEEERRLFYVGATRAEKILFLTYARTRYRYGEHHDSLQSRFLDEIDPAVVRTEAGSRPSGSRRDRFSLTGTGGQSRCDNMDTHYWRKLDEPSVRKEPMPTRPGGGAERIVYDEGEGGPIVAGMRVEHGTFGEGKVLSLEGSGSQAKAVIFFQEVGQKKLLLKFARLRRVE